MCVHHPFTHRTIHMRFECQLNKEVHKYEVARWDSIECTYATDKMKYYLVLAR